MTVSPVPITLCIHCRKIPAKFFSNARDKQCSVWHHPSWAELKECSASCRLCKLFVVAVDRYEGEYAWPKKWKESDPVRLESTKFSQQKIWVNFETGVFRGKEIPSDWSDPLLLNEHIGSEELRMSEAGVIERWEKLCSTTHKHCAELVGKGYIPTRLVAVDESDGNTLHLRTMSGGTTGDTRYLALSHCWGPNMALAARTTLDTMLDRSENISFDSLPRTFQDFILIARRLEIPYVWIDSLCIIQDSSEDWEHEAAQMASVYANAHLTVSASGSTDGTGGCRILEEDRSYGPVDALFSENPDSSIAPKRAFRIWCRDPHPIQSKVREDPINKRGWCLQERELSPRVVHYSKDTVRWECRDLKASYEFPWGDGISFNEAMRLFDNGQLDCPTLGPKSLGKLSTVDYNKALLKQRLVWFDLVFRYTQRVLTRQTDILPAISGIAQAVARSTNDKYYAGLWSSYLPYCLLWSRKTKAKGEIQHSRPESYLAPSWSWASVKGAVMWAEHIVSRYSYNPDPDPAFVPEILNVQVESAGSDPFGMLKGGFMQVHGKLRPAFTRNERHVKNAEEPDAENLYITDAETTKTGLLRTIGGVTFDVPLCEDCAPLGGVKFVFLLCCMNNKPDQDGRFSTLGLALQPADGTPMDVARGRFRRVGLAGSIEPEFWAEAQAITITIV